MKRTIAIVFLIILTISCSNKKENLTKLNSIMKDIDKALVSSDREYVEGTITNIAEILPLFPKNQSIRQKKATLELRLKDYKSAIATIDDLLVVNPKNIDFLIIQGIILEIEGDVGRSRESLNSALTLLSSSEKFLNTTQRGLMKGVNRLMVLKLLKQDGNSDYEELLSNPDIESYPSIKKSIILLKNGDRENLINTYR